MTYDEFTSLRKLLSRCSAWAYEHRTRIHHAGELLDHINRHIDDIATGFSMLLANSPSEVQPDKVSDRDELREEMCRLSHDLRDVRVELARVAERLRLISDAATKDDLDKHGEKVTMKLSELQGSLQEVKTASLKAFSEIRSRIDALDAKITELTGELANATVPADAQGTIADLKTISKQLDDIVPDAPELPPPTIPPTEPAARR